MRDNKHTGRSFNGKGYYIALILCAAAIGISGYLYQKNQSKVQEVSVQETQPMMVVVEPAPEDIPVIAPRETVAPTEVREPVNPVKENPVKVDTPAEPSRKPLKVMSPVEGQEIMPYSVEALSYNETTRDWRTHDGVDLAAQEGTQVCAAAQGKVYTTYEDDNLGHTVVILHNGGYTTRYASLSEDLLVKAGDSVEVGQPIGYVGTSAMVESVMGPHVHFSTSFRDIPMDPAEFLKLS